MNGKKIFGLLALGSALASYAAQLSDPSFACERIFREARLTRGNTGIFRIQPIDSASWIWIDEALPSAEVDVCIFRKSFEVKAGEGPLTIDVSADERFYLTCDGNFVARGPNRGTVENWQYQTYRLTLAPGRHELRAVVTRVGNHAPLAQLSYRGGFILKADDAFDARLTTGVAKWEVARFTGMRPMGTDNGAWGTGSQFEITGSGPFAVDADDWRAAVVVRDVVDPNYESHGGLRTKGWMLYPAQIPDQTETPVRPGAFRAAAYGTAWRTNHIYTAAETRAPEVAAFNALLRGESRRVTVPAHTRLQLAWYLDRYICAYPQLTIAGGKGARVSWGWTESSRDPADGRKHNRGDIVGKFLQGYGDVFVSDGRATGTFSAPWFRCGLWCRIDIETRDEPLDITDIVMFESRYPLEMESVFESPDDPSLQDIRRICARAMQMCCHEMLFDCPYYEQQMYAGDSRVQLLVLSALSRDERMIKRVIDLYNLAARDDGQSPFNWPTRGTQEGFTYTLCYLCTFGDYVMNHDDLAWLRARLPGLRKTMAGCEYYENADGLVEHTPGWNFMDWAIGWESNGVLKNCDRGYELNAFANLFWLLAIQSAEKAERALGNGLQAQYWAEKAAKLKTQIVRTFWDESRGLLADTPAKLTYSEHVQALAIVADALPADKRETCFAHLISDADLARTTVYFSYYLFEAYFRMGRADLFQKRLDLWRGYVAKGITTLSEMPDTPELEGRSDCHAWGSHPIWLMQAGFAGIRSDAPSFAKVRVAPQPGSMKSIRAKHPHPQGWIELALSFDGDKATGTVKTPVAGTFAYGGREIPLHAGDNVIE